MFGWFHIAFGFKYFILSIATELLYNIITILKFHV